MPNGDSVKTRRAPPDAPGTAAVGSSFMSYGPAAVRPTRNRTAHVRIGLLDLRVVLDARRAAFVAVEAVDVEEPQTGAHVGDHHQAIVVADVDAEGALLDAHRGRA